MASPTSHLISAFWLTDRQTECTWLWETHALGRLSPALPEALRLSAPRSVGLLAGGGISPRPESRSGETSAPERGSCQGGAGKTPHLVTVLQRRSGGSQSVPHGPARESPSLKAAGRGAVQQPRRASLGWTHSLGPREWVDPSCHLSLGEEEPSRTAGEPPLHA